MRFLLLTAALLLAGSVRAQVPNINPKLLPRANRWNAGVKLGTGLEFTTPEAFRQPARNLSYVTGGLTGGYLLARANFLMTLQADALLERRAARPWNGVNDRSYTLFVPVYLRTGLPKNRLHLLLGGGGTFWVDGNKVPPEFRGQFATHPVDVTGMTGVEVRVAPAGVYETTLALTYRHSFSRSLTYYRGATGAGPDFNEFYNWVGVTLNVYLHQPRRPQ